jgi:hypothetical protein
MFESILLLLLMFTSVAVLIPTILIDEWKLWRFFSVIFSSPLPLHVSYHEISQLGCLLSALCCLSEFAEHDTVLVRSGELNEWHQRLPYKQCIVLIFGNNESQLMNRIGGEKLFLPSVSFVLIYASWFTLKIFVKWNTAIFQQDMCFGISINSLKNVKKVSDGSKDFTALQLSSPWKYCFLKFNFRNVLDVCGLLHERKM